MWIRFRHIIHEAATTCTYFNVNWLFVSKYFFPATSALLWVSDYDM
ncbi:hypothetical protein BMB171_C4338 [Bacillus thuringiensis BMB171]|nr:hypothetical protein BMB171_C4338 [Bacillus thuringiensis BMB171]